MEKILISHKTAYRYWLGGVKRIHPDETRCDIGKGSQVKASAKLVADARELLGIPQVHDGRRKEPVASDAFEDGVDMNRCDAPSLDLCVASTSERRLLPGVNCYLRSGDSWHNSACCLSPTVMVAAPELTFSMLAGGSTIQELIAYGNALCSTYPVVQSSSLLVDERKPLTTKKRLRAYLENCAGYRGRKKAQTALRWICEGSASQREATLATILLTPRFYGGMGFPKAELNHRIFLDRESRKMLAKDFVIADIVWPKQKLIVEYDSFIYHGSKDSFEGDALRRNVLIGMGFRVVSITNGMIKTEGGRADIEDLLTSLIYPMGRRKYDCDQSIKRQLIDAAFRIPSGRV